MLSHADTPQLGRTRSWLPHVHHCWHCSIDCADVDIDTPLLVPVQIEADNHDACTGPSYSGLTEEQRAAKVEELRKKIAQRKAERAVAEKVSVSLVYHSMVIPMPPHHRTR
jgi:hypothetical protein